MGGSSLLLGCSLLALLLLVRQAPHGDAAPTHHLLTIGVEGKTPTLVETSAELVAGEAPARPAALAAGGTVAPLSPPVVKGGPPGPKQKAPKATKQNQSLAKKRQHYASKEKSAWHAKALTAAAATTPTTTTTTKPTTTTTATTTTTTTTATTTTNTPAPLPREIITTTSAAYAHPTPAPATPAAPVVTAPASEPYTAEASTTDAAAGHGETTHSPALGQLPAERRQTPTTDSSGADLTTLQPALPTVQHDSNIIINAAAGAVAGAGAGTARTLDAVPTATATETATETTTTATTNPPASNDGERASATTTAAAPVPATTARVATTTAQTTPATESPTPARSADDDRSTRTPATAATSTTQSDSHRDVPKTPLIVATTTTTTTTESQGAVELAPRAPAATTGSTTTGGTTSRTRSSTTSTSTEAVTRGGGASGVDVDVEGNGPGGGDGDVIKLIDLEKYERGAKKAGLGGARHHDDGHDGVKQTKKKQLIIEQHYLGTTRRPAAVSDAAQPATAAPAIAEQPSTTTTTARTKGYLGPIFMEERTISAAASHKGAQHEHEPSIESQLRDGRIVEIIAPTAALEPTTTTTTITPTTSTTTTTTTTTTAPPPPTAGQGGSVLSSTVFQVPEAQTSTTRLPVEGVAPKIEGQSESRISDIQIEVYDSTVDSTIVASTNFKDSSAFYRAPPVDGAAGVATTRPPGLLPVTQERFTQYVVDRTDSSTPESSVLPLSLSAGGKPEPAAIEIHINVSEGLLGNEGEDLEFSYRQAEYTDRSRPRVLGKASELISLKPFGGGASSSANDTSSGSGSNERSDEILVVEIIDAGGDNGTDNGNGNGNYASSESVVNPIFTFRAEGELNAEPVEAKHQRPPSGSPVSDELFMVDMKSGFHHPPPPPPPPPRSPSIDRDSDTIFYISNTEVKVGESPPPTANSNADQQQQQQQMRRTRLENQFFPASYMASTHPNAAKFDAKSQPQPRRYEEDILLAPQRNSADSFKIFRTQGDGAPPLDVTYVGESVMEVEEQPATAASPNAPIPAPPDVIIQPAILPEMSIGVPVIGELPPQIELKEIDFMPDEVNEPHSGVFESSNAIESSVQYGGDLIDEGAGGGGGFDGVEGSYPFGNPAAQSGQQHQDADYTHLALSHGGSSFRKDELSIDVASSAEQLGGRSTIENGTLREMLAKLGNESASSMNISYAVAERMGNATAFSVMEDPGAASEPEFAFRNFYTLIIGLFVVLLPVAVTISMACALRYLYSKYQSSSSDNNDNTDALQPNGNAGGGGDHGESTEPPSPTKSEQDLERDLDLDRELDLDQESVSNAPAETARSDQTEPSGDCAIDMAGAEAPHPSDTLSARSQLGADPTPIAGSDFANGPNGSVTTMTLKNNHLIVETEERNDISRDARETKMHYNTADKDGIFVVEVARGADSKAIPESPIAEAGELRIPLYDSKLLGAASATLKTENEKPRMKNHEEVLIHQPPPEVPGAGVAATDELQRSLHQIEEVDEPIASPAAELAGAEDGDLALNAKTGLSQSDLSSTSSTDSNKRYSYGNQELYVVEQTGYAQMSPTANMPLAMAAEELPDDDHKSENGHSLLHSPAQSHGQGMGTATGTGSSSNADNEKRLTNGHHEVNGLGPAAEKDVAPVEVEPETETETETDAEAETAEPEIETETETETTETVVEKIAAAATAEPTIEEAPEAEAVETPPAAANEPGDLPNGKDNKKTPGMEEDEKEPAAENGAETESGPEVESEPEPETEPKTEAEAETEPENAYDSIVSLPAPPSTEEIKQFSDFSLIETNQLDSLPPPPPPAEVSVENGTDTNDDADTATDVERTEPKAQLAPVLSNGGLETPNGHDMEFLRALAPPIAQGPANGKVLPAPLTPPASPPPSSLYGHSAVNGGLRAAALPMAVDVNGS